MARHMQELSWNFRLFLIAQKNPYLNQATQKILAKIFLPKKIPKTKISTPPKSLYHPCSLNSGVQSVAPPLPPPLAYHSHFLYVWLSASCWLSVENLKISRFHYYPKVDDWVYFKAR